MLRVGDLVEIKNGNHWDGFKNTRIGFVTGTGNYYKSYVILFIEDGDEKQFHASFIRLLSPSYGKRITFVQKI